MFENLTTTAGSDSHFLQLHLIVLFQDCGLRYSEKFKRGLRSCYLLGYLGHRSSCSDLFLFLYQQRLHRVKVELFNGYTMEVNTKQWNEKDLQALEDKHFSVQGVRCNLLVGDCHGAVFTTITMIFFSVFAIAVSFYIDCSSIVLLWHAQRIHYGTLSKSIAAVSCQDSYDEGA